MTEKVNQLDAYDLKILNLLTVEGRITWRELADAIGLSLTPTLRRTPSLAERPHPGGCASLDERLLIGAIGAFVSVSLERQSEEALAVFEARVRELEEVTSCFQMTGDFDYRGARSRPLPGHVRPAYPGARGLAYPIEFRAEGRGQASWPRDLTRRSREAARDCHPRDRPSSFRTEPVARFGPEA